MIDQGELFSIPNPCKGVCTSNSRGYCRGCLRSRQERFHWNEFTAFQQQLIVNLCEKRRLKIIAARDGLSDDEDFGEAPDQRDLFLAEEDGDAMLPANDADITSGGEQALPEIAMPQEEVAAEETPLSARDMSDTQATSEPSSETETAEKSSPPPATHPGDQFDLF